MRKVVSFLLAGLMLVSGFMPQNELAELGKLPQLVAHYRFHHSVAGGGWSLPQFLAEHYGSGTPRHFGCTFSPQHQQDHQGLPLHGRHECSSHVAFLLLAPVPPLGPRAEASASPHYRPAGRVHYQGGPVAALLQPPRA